MSEVLLFIVLFVALLAGWIMGRRKSSSRLDSHKSSVPPDYFRGLNHLLNNQHSEAIDAFVDSLQVNSETFDIHLTLGNLFRKKGEIEKAINVHQNLLARPEITPREMRLVQLELASDFMSAGLLDRAERLLLNIAAKQTEFQPTVLVLLVDLYEFEQSWDQAIQIGHQLYQLNKKQALAKRLAHFYCEIADEKHAKGKSKEALADYQKALDIDEKCVRASMGAADVFIAQKRYRDAIKELKLVASQDKDFVPITIPLLRDCYEKVWGNSGFTKFLQEQNRTSPSATIILALAQRLSKDNKEYAEIFLIDQLRKHPTIKGFRELVQMQLNEATDEAKEHLEVLYELLDQLTENKHKHLCRQCGFSGFQLHWKCPSCKSWGTVKPIHGLEGE
ncbi:lipopolysaccharide assembly protein LapB [Marinomonas sp. MED121]|uniref:lipopolysaccharide assembly protein LapB n=1 Tax=Marinomonas sp. MED121 TaxID=314277 RepID=UPI0002E359DB|nr:lipopolysaccharide assembly protein LapB [Marinomonas sp. MED121]